MFRIKTVLASGNAKLGPIPASWATANTCPSSCPLAVIPKGKRAPACYWFAGYRTRLLARNLESGKTAGYEPSQFVAWIKTLPARAIWRDRVGGDQIPDLDNSENIDAKNFHAVARANRKRKLRGFTYTHYDLLHNEHNRELVEAGYNSGYVVNASTDNVFQAMQLKHAHPGLSVVTLAKSTWTDKDTTHDGVRFVLCPNVWNKAITCQRCGICAEGAREYVVVFPAHGTGKGAANIIATDQREAA